MIMAKNRTQLDLEAKFMNSLKCAVGKWQYVLNQKNATKLQQRYKREKYCNKADKDYKNYTRKARLEIYLFRWKLFTFLENLHCANAVDSSSGYTSDADASLPSPKQISARHLDKIAA